MLLGFVRKNKGSGAHSPAHHPLPATATDHGARAWFEAFGMPFVRENWSVLINVLLALALVVVGLLAWRFAERASRAEEGPLVLVGDAQTGELTVSRKSLRKFEPGELNKVWFLREWVRMFQTQNAATTTDDLKVAYSWTRGTASAQFKDWLNQNQPVRALEEDPTLSREISNVTVNFLEHNACVLRYTQVSRRGSAAPELQKYVLTANYVLDPPTNARELDQAGNPLGLSITHFTIARETGETR